MASTVHDQAALAPDDAPDNDRRDSTAASERTERARQLQIARQRRYRSRQKTAASALQHRALEMLQENAALEREIIVKLNAKDLD